MLMLWMRATSGRNQPNRGDSASPACGPVPVTAGPVNIRPTIRTTAILDSHSSAGDLWPPGSVGLAGAPQEHDRVGDQDHRQQEVAGDRGGVQADQHGDPPSTIWPMTPATRPHDSTPGPPVGPSTDRAENRGGDRQRYQTGEQPVDLLDGLVGVAELEHLREQFGQSSHPARARQADGGTGDHDGAQQRESHRHDAPVGAGRQGQRTGSPVSVVGVRGPGADGQGSPPPVAGSRRPVGAARRSVGASWPPRRSPPRPPSERSWRPRSAPTWRSPSPGSSSSCS